MNYYFGFMLPACLIRIDNQQMIIRSSVNAALEKKMTENH